MPGTVKAKHLQAYLDEFVFRFNRRKTNGVGRIAARTIEQLVAARRKTLCHWLNALAVGPISPAT